eukprot:CAMPEP_0182542420 /NCGR_PEP_ID=MMETSP1323-20130603/30114_1 /TAXON_ID=236787 /ORGANISM="Florenciella parvula, Strain RCC1693" /LENGTH=133 /DNA_ID=CAMNT_0024753269 /DNA_START=57 /DNA_END=458 /DNA_ORIENTATION=-
MTNGNYGDALGEFEQVLRLREEQRDESVSAQCKLADTNLQVAFAYLEHSRSNPGADVLVESTDGTTTRIASASECRPQLEAYHQRAATILKDLIQRLRDQRRPIDNLSDDEKADISDLMHELQRFGQEADGIE